MKGWQNSIRHNLTLGKKKLFTKIDRDGKRSFWSLNPGVELSVSKKTTEKTKKASSKNTNKPQVPKLVSSSEIQIPNQASIQLPGTNQFLFTLKTTEFPCESK